VYRVPGGEARSGVLRTAAYRDMRRLLSPRLLAIAVERSIRGDELQLVEGDQELIGVIWQASGSRRQLVLGGVTEATDDEAVYYQPIPVGQVPLNDLLRGLSPEGSCLVAIPGLPTPDDGMEHLGGYPGDAAFKRSAGEPDQR
jgi:hypothetical protein